MTYPRLRIEPGKGHKGRTFEVALFNYAQANKAWESGSSDFARPVYVSFAGSDQEARAFAANLRTGRKCRVIDRRGHEEDTLECLRSAGYRWAQQKVAGEALVITAYLPELFDFDPGMLPERVRFCFAPPTWWLDRQAESLVASADLSIMARYGAGGGAREAAVASYFAAYLDRRIPLPVVNDAVFHARLWRAAQQRPWFHRSGGSAYSPGPLHVFPADLVGLEDFVLVDGSAAAVEEFVYEQTRVYFEEERPEHLLSDLEPPPPPPVRAPEPECEEAPVFISPAPIPAGLQLSLFD